ncbi:hypothetical protein P886_1991 [Alteromonadaceae bacterium 2753L.S.0a.02]|nr:hypothetical protein P886_1991 [Alteromonadaceae bacterium 2753L.S.0a.02]
MQVLQGVIRKVSIMNKLAAAVIIVLVSIYGLGFTCCHYVYTGDTVANYTGYFVSLVVLPMIWIMVPSSVIVTIKRHTLTKIQKWFLVMAPATIQVVFIGLTFWAFQYAQH